MDYKDTLNLPKTEFLVLADAPQIGATDVDNFSAMGY